MALLSDIITVAWSLFMIIIQIINHYTGVSMTFLSFPHHNFNLMGKIPSCIFHCVILHVLCNFTVWEALVSSLLVQRGFDLLPLKGTDIAYHK